MLMCMRLFSYHILLYNRKWSRKTSRPSDTPSHSFRIPHLAKRRHCCGLCKLPRRLDLHIRLAKKAISMSCQYTHALRRSFASQKACLLLPLVAIDCFRKLPEGVQVPSWHLHARGRQPKHHQIAPISKAKPKHCLGFETTSWWQDTISQY